MLKVYRGIFTRIWLIDFANCSMLQSRERERFNCTLCIGYESESDLE